MKKIVVSFIFCMLAFTDIINAQTTCDGVAGVTVFGGGQSNGNNLWGIRVGLNQAYSYDITVSGNIYKLLDHNYSDPFNVTIPAGTTSYELDPYFPVPPDDGAGAEVTDVTPCPFILSEEQSEEIVQSSEFQLVFNLQNQFLDTISTALSHGISLESIRAAAIDAVVNNNTQQFYSLLFTSSQNGQSFVNSVVQAKQNFVSNHTFIQENPNSFSCQTCNTSPSDQVNYFFDHFSIFNDNREMPNNESDQSKRVCGSWWNQIKLAACATACSFATVGIATPLCGWGCWCMLCTRNSAVADAICQ